MPITAPTNIVNSSSGATSGASQSSGALGTAIPVGSTVLVTARSGSTTIPWTCVDSAGNIYFRSYYTNTTTGNAAIFFAPITTALTTTNTVTVSLLTGSSAHFSVSVYVINGSVNWGTSQDIYAFASNVKTTLTPSSLSVPAAGATPTLQSAGSLVILALSFSTTVTSLAATGYTLLNQNDYLATMYKITTDTSGQSATATWTTNSYAAGVMSIFRPSNPARMLGFEG